MTEKSWWWDGKTLGDATLAAYISATHSTLEQSKFGDTYNYFQGVFGGILNSLEVYASSTTGVKVKSGAAIVNGRTYYNDDDTTEFTVSGISKYWLIALFKDGSAQTVRAASYGPYNDEATAMAALVHTADDWSIPLAIVRTTAGGIILDIDDHRVYALRPSIAYAYVPAVCGYNTTDATNIVRNAQQGVLLPDNHRASAYGQWSVPPNYWKTMSVDAIAIASATGDCYQRGVIRYGEIGSSYGSYSEALAFAVVAMSANAVRLCHSFTSPTIPESECSVVYLEYERDAVNVLDTVNNSVYVSGWLIKYVPLY